MFEKINPSEFGKAVAVPLYESAKAYKIIGEFWGPDSGLVLRKGHGTRSMGKCLLRLTTF